MSRGIVRFFSVSLLRWLLNSSFHMQPQFWGLACAVREGTGIKEQSTWSLGASILGSKVGGVGFSSAWAGIKARSSRLVVFRDLKAGYLYSHSFLVSFTEGTWPYSLHGRERGSSEEKVPWFSGSNVSFALMFGIKAGICLLSWSKPGTTAGSFLQCPI